MYQKELIIRRKKRKPKKRRKKKRKKKEEKASNNNTIMQICQAPTPAAQSAEQAYVTDSELVKTNQFDILRRSK